MSVADGLDPTNCNGYSATDQEKKPFLFYLFLNPPLKLGSFEKTILL